MFGDIRPDRSSITASKFFNYCRLQVSIAGDLLYQSWILLNSLTPDVFVGYYVSIEAILIWIVTDPFVIEISG
jgi:hypothetical protein